MVVVLAAWAFGEVARNRRAAIEEAMRRAAGEEQARIARELHDVIAHSVSVIVVQAAAADEVFDAQPEQARAALRSIETAGRDALRELRLLLAAVRPGADADHAPAARARPSRGAGRAAARRRPRRRGAQGRRDASVPAGVDLSAYRIVQEALTNTLRHAHATRAEVTVRVGADVLELDVLDDGRGAAGERGDGNGRGLAGMRERAAMLGGTLEAGPPAAAATASTRVCPWRRWSEHPRPARRRPGARARRLPDDPGREGRSGGGRGGRGRRRGSRTCRSCTDPTSS